MRWDHFAGSLVFAVLAAAVLPLLWPVAATLFAGAHTFGVCWIALGGLYGIGWVRGRGRLALAVLAWGMAWIFMLALPASPLPGVAVTSLLLAFMRSGASLRGWTPRRIGVEAAIAAVSLAWVDAFLAPSALALGVTAWGSFLIQSVYPLCRDWIEESAKPRGVDPFDQARSRLIALLDEGR